MNRFTHHQLFYISPNPASTFINLRVRQNLVGSTYNLSDIVGKTLLTGKLTNENTMLDLSSLTSGMYFINVSGTYKQTIKILKQ